MFDRKELSMIMSALMNEEIYKSKEIYEQEYCCEEEKRSLEKQVENIRLLTKKVFNLINEN